MVSCNFQVHFVLKAYSVYIISEALFFRRPREWKVISWRPVFMVLKGILWLDGGKINTSVKNGRERKRIYLQTSPTCLPARRRQRQDWPWRSENARLPTCFRSWRTPHRFHGGQDFITCTHASQNNGASSCSFRFLFSRFCMDMILRFLRHDFRVPNNIRSCKKITLPYFHSIVYSKLEVKL